MIDYKLSVTARSVRPYCTCTMFATYIYHCMYVYRPKYQQPCELSDCYMLCEIMQLWFSVNHAALPLCVTWSVISGGLQWDIYVDLYIQLHVITLYIAMQKLCTCLSVCNEMERHRLLFAIIIYYVWHITDEIQ